MDATRNARRLVSLVGLEEIACLHCERRLKDGATMTGDGRMRCGHCAQLTYFIPAPRSGLAILVSVTSAELMHAQRHELTVPQLLAYLGLSDPFTADPVLAQRSR